MLLSQDGQDVSISIVLKFSVRLKWFYLHQLLSLSAFLALFMVMEISKDPLL